MSVLRGIQPIVKVTGVFVFVLIAASTLTILTPRPTHAEGFLLGTVRCLVRTVLTAECQKPQTTPAPAPSERASTQSNSSQTPSQPPAPAGGTKEGVPIDVEPIAPLDPEAAALPAVPDVQGVQTTAANRLDESEYIAYFNAHSPYAVEGQAAASEAVIQAGPDGWKIFGVAWYWWGLVVAACVGIFASVKYRFFSKASVLLKGR